MNIGKYQYGKSTIALSSILLVAGVVYGFYTHKPALTIVLAGLVGSAMGIGIGMIIYEPKRIKE